MFVLLLGIIGYVGCCCCIPKNIKCLNHIKDKFSSARGLYRAYFGEDKKYWFVMLVVKEIVEIIFQLLALFNYNGLNLFDGDELILSYKPFEIKVFAVLLGINSIIVGILWIFYILNGNLCRGLFFKQVVFVTDTVFDSFYALYPIAVVTFQTGFQLYVAVGVLQATNMYVIKYTLRSCLCLFFSCFLSNLSYSYIIIIIMFAVFSSILCV